MSRRSPGHDGRGKREFARLGENGRFGVRGAAAGIAAVRDRQGATSAEFARMTMAAVVCAKSNDPRNGVSMSARLLALAFCPVATLELAATTVGESSNAYQASESVKGAGEKLKGRWKVLAYQFNGKPGDP